MSAKLSLPAFIDYLKGPPPIDDWRARADEGDPDAQIALAWQYATGEYVKKDIEKALALFRSAESQKPQFARFYLAKAKLLLNNDASYPDDLAEDCEAGFGPALYLMGAAAHRARNRSEALHYFALAAENGHLVSEFFVWRLSRKGLLDRILTFPYSVRLFARIMVILFHDEYDIRLLR